jgi:hypothetical protein
LAFTPRSDSTAFGASTWSGAPAVRVRSGAKPARKQRTVWLGSGVVTGGKLARHSSVASSHRNANEHPTGRLPGAGARPGRPTIRSSSLMSGAAAVR